MIAGRAQRSRTRVVPINESTNPLPAALKFLWPGGLINSALSTTGSIVDQVAQLPTAAVTLVAEVIDTGQGWVRAAGDAVISEVRHGAAEWRESYRRSHDTATELITRQTETVLSYLPPRW